MSFSWQVLITVFTLGGIGAVVRALVLYILGVASIFIFPLGVLFINMLAAFLGGFITAMALPEELHIAFVIGFVGGMGTLSSISADVIDLYYDRIQRRVSGILLLVLYLVLITLMGTLCAQGGIALGKFFHGDSELEPIRQMEMQMLQESLYSGPEHNHELLSTAASASTEDAATASSSLSTSDSTTAPAPESTATNTTTTTTTDNDDAATTTEEAK